MSLFHSNRAYLGFSISAISVFLHNKESARILHKQQYTACRCIHQHSHTNIIIVFSLVKTQWFITKTWLPTPHNGPAPGRSKALKHHSKTLPFDYLKSNLLLDLTRVCPNGVPTVPGQGSDQYTKENQFTLPHCYGQHGRS